MCPIALALGLEQPLAPCLVSVNIQHPTELGSVSTHKLGR
eukprot:COSAG05_NODE_17184_length_330_cov_0.670996_1_plen_39_part_01